jgi:acyl dehydratase
MIGRGVGRQPRTDQPKSQSVDSVHVVTRDEVIRFARAIGSTTPIHYDADVAIEAGFRDVVAPPFFFQVLGLSLGRNVARAELGVDGTPLTDDLHGRKVVAGETAIQWFGDIVAGDEISLTQRLIETRRERGSTGDLDVYVYERVYSRGLEPLVVETYTRIAR